MACSWRWGSTSIGCAEHFPMSRETFGGLGRIGEVDCLPWSDQPWWIQVQTIPPARRWIEPIAVGFWRCRFCTASFGRWTCCWKSYRTGCIVCVRQIRTGRDVAEFTRCCHCVAGDSLGLQILRNFVAGGQELGLVVDLNLPRIFLAPTMNTDQMMPDAVLQHHHMKTNVADSWVLDF